MSLFVFAKLILPYLLNVLKTVSCFKKRDTTLLGGRKTVKFKKCENLWFSENGVTSVTPFFRL